MLHRVDASGKIQALARQPADKEIRQRVPDCLGFEADFGQIKIEVAEDLIGEELLLLEADDLRGYGDGAKVGDRVTPLFEP